MRSKKTTAKAVFALKKAENSQWVDKWVDKTALKIGSSFSVLWGFMDFQGGFWGEFGDFYKVIFRGIFGVSCLVSVGFENVLTFVCRKNKGKGDFRRKIAGKMR